MSCNGSHNALDGVFTLVIAGLLAGSATIFYYFGIGPMLIALTVILFGLAALGLFVIAHGPEDDQL